MKREMIVICGAALLLAGVLMFRGEEDRPVPKESVEEPPTPVAEEKEVGATEEAPPEYEEPEPVDVRKVLAELAEAIRNGDREKALSLLEILRGLAVPPMVPDDQNAALVYQKAFEIMDKFPLEGELEKAFQRALKGEELSAEDRKLLSEWMEKNAEAIDLIKHAAARPHCRFPLKYDDGFAMDLPHISKVLRAGKMLQVEEILKNLEGNPAAATEASWASLAMGRALQGEPVLISQIVSGLVEGLASKSLQSSLDLSSEDLTSLLDGLDPAGHRETYRRCMILEVFAAVSLFESGKGSEGLEKGWSEWLKDPIRPQDVAFYVETMSEIIDAADLPYHQAREKIELIEKVRYEGAPWYAEATRYLMPAYKRVVKRVARSEAQRSMLRLALDLERYRESHSGYPATLEALGTDLPVDPFTGKSFTYAPAGTGYTLTSPGGSVDDPLVWTRGS